MFYLIQNQGLVSNGDQPLSNLTENENEREQKALSFSYILVKAYLPRFSHYITSTLQLNYFSLVFYNIP